MKKDELYGKIDQLPTILGWQGYGVKVMVVKNSVLELVRQLDKPQEVVVPQLVAEWIDFAKEKHLSLHQSMDYYPRTDEMDGWLRNRDNQELFARAWLDGYTIEREKLYTVEIPNPNNTSKNVMVLRRVETGIEITRSNSQTYRDSEHCQLTEAEIRKDFEWAWQFAREVG